ncbi:MAG: YcgN family cysteine cluster protein [Pseudomonadota bacterium]
MSGFWQERPLAELSAEEWESLCDGCARCCLIKLEDEQTGELYTTAVACRYLQLDDCGCSVYAERTRLVPDCVKVTPESVDSLYFMPQSCAYRLLAQGQGLPAWHPLLSGDRRSVSDAGIAICDTAISEQELPEGADWESYILG